MISPITPHLTGERAGVVGESSETSPSHAPFPGGKVETSFSDIFAQVVAQANQADAVATKKVDALANGVNDDLHGTMIATKEADISIKLVASIRNKLLDGFNELWKTSV